jgi:outer membrane protein W
MDRLFSPATTDFQRWANSDLMLAAVQRTPSSSRNSTASVKNLQVHNNWGSVLQGGAEYELNSKYTLFFDFKEVWLAVNAHGVLSDGTDVKARVKLNPSLFTVGIKFHLPFGQGH